MNECQKYDRAEKHVTNHHLLHAVFVFTWVTAFALVLQSFVTIAKVINTTELYACKNTNCIKYDLGWDTQKNFRPHPLPSGRPKSRDFPLEKFLNHVFWPFEPHFWG